MPAPGVPNNAAGYNGGYDDGAENAYGTVKRLAQQTRAEPLAGADQTGRALNSPKRAQRKGVRPAEEPTRAPLAAPPVAQGPTTAPPVSLAATWDAIAATPGATAYPILEQMAEAARGSQ